MHDKVVKDQEEFFNTHAHLEYKQTKDFFYFYSIKEQYKGFDYLNDCRHLLDYGCGTATSIDVFFEQGVRKLQDYDIIGVDIAEEALLKARAKYPTYTFAKLENNTITMVPDNSQDGAYMLHVLHHSTGHEKMFSEIYRTLTIGGKFFLSDLTSANPFVRIGRFIFPFVSRIASAKFEDDLVVDGKIPEKYRIDKADILNMLSKTGFTLVDVGEGHLFFFLVNWVSRFLPFLHLEKHTQVLKKLVSLEDYLISKTFLKKYTEVFYVLARKA